MHAIMAPNPLTERRIIRSCLSHAEDDLRTPRRTLRGSTNKSFSMLRARVQTQIGSRVSSMKIAGVLVLLGLRLHGRRLLLDRHQALLLGHGELHFCAGTASMSSPSTTFRRLELADHSTCIACMSNTTAAITGGIPSNRQAQSATMREKKRTRRDPVMPHI